MANWIISQNERAFLLKDYLNNFTEISWRQGKNNFQLGDIVYIYNSFPSYSIQYKMVIVKRDIGPECLYDESAYFGPRHQDNDPDGLAILMRLISRANEKKVVTQETLLRYLGQAGLQGRRKTIPDELLQLIEDSFDESIAPTDINLDPFSDSIHDPHSNILEGAKVTVSVNRYERSIEARNKCIKKWGCKCAVCGMDFEKVYGSLGRGFIHVHHIIPISEIGKQYKVDPRRDLIPVCPNCHAMLHKGRNGKVLSVEELKEILNKSK